MKKSFILAFLIIFLTALNVLEITKDNNGNISKNVIQKISVLPDIVSVETNVSDEYQTCKVDSPCSLDDLKKQQKQNNSNENEEKNNEENKGIFVDGGKYNRPEYTEMFLFRGPFWF